jgi:hypothetical protein
VATALVGLGGRDGFPVRFSLADDARCDGQEQPIVRGVGTVQGQPAVDDGPELRRAGGGLAHGVVRDEVDADDGDRVLDEVFVGRKGRAHRCAQGDCLRDERTAQRRALAGR